MKPKLLIVFSDEWVSYSPTILNLVNLLENHFAVTVVAFDDGRYKNDTLPQSQFRLLKIRHGMLRWLQDKRLVKLYKVIRLFANLVRESADHVIAVDSVSFLASQFLFEKIHFLSLEVKHDFVFALCRKRKILSVLIQTPERYDFQFGTDRLRTFFVPNSPIQIAGEPAGERQSHHLVYFGNVIPTHGIFQCLEAIRLLPSVKLTVKGIINPELMEVFDKQYGDLLASGQVILDTTYVRQEDVVAYLCRFAAGFCFYDFDLIAKNDFNYLSVPSGKMYNYYAAGVPVIGSDIPGLSSVSQYGAGILLKNPKPEAIATAVLEVFQKGTEMRRGCDRAAKDFDFRTRVQPFKDFLLSS